MKTKIIIQLSLAMFMIIASDIQAQQPKTGACLGSFPVNPSNSTRAWLRGGNLAAGAGGSDNIFGTCFNSPIFTITDGTLRTWLNGRFTAIGTTAQPSINGVLFGNTPTTVNTSGYFGIGFSGVSSPLNPVGGTGPMSLLHLQGPNNTIFQGANQGGGAGWRSWMKTGTYIVENTDAMYVGMKSEAVAGGTNRSDAVINWSDDPNPGGGGPDNLRFIFTRFANSGIGNCTSCPTFSEGFDGLEIARMTGAEVNGVAYGRVGIGPFFTDILPPARRLEVMDDLNRPQLRLTYTQDPNPLFGSHTDFFEDPQANLNILPTVGFLGQVLEKFVGINTTAGTPQNTLEIQAGALSPNWNLLATNGTSGLRFRFMNSTKTPIANPGSGVLSVDSDGDVIYVAGGSSGTCTTPTIFPVGVNGAVDLSFNGNHNFYYEGQGVTSTTQSSSVGIGWPCSPLNAKLDVLQASGSTNGSIGILVENRDRQITPGAPPTIGLKSLVSSAMGIGSNCRKVAGWFESTYAPNCAGTLVQYAIYVPGTNSVSQTGGTVDIGYPFATNTPDYILDVNGVARIGGTFVGSDSILKTNIIPFTAGLNVIRNLNPKFYHYNGKGGFDTQHQYIGVIAENLASVAPYAVDSSLQKLDSADAEPTSILNVYNEAIMYTSLNAIKELDSAVTALQNAPGGVSGTGTANFLTKWNGANTVTSSSVFDDGTNVGIGTSNPQATLEVRGNVISVDENAVLGNRGFVTYQNNSNIHGALFSGYKSRGTHASPTSVQNGDYGYVFANTFHGSSQYTNSGALAFSVDGTVTGNNIPSQVEIITSTTGNEGTSNYGQTRLIIKSDGKVGIGTTAPTEELHVVGNILATGSISQNSDATLKQNIDTISNALGIIIQLQPHTFNFDTTNYSFLNLPSGKQYGLTAQEAEVVLPEIVSNSLFAQVNTGGNTSLSSAGPETHYKTVNYTALIPILIQAVKEQQEKISQLESTVSTCCSTNVKSTSSVIPSSNEDLASGAMLYQNRPNPYTNETSIRYFVPENSIAAMVFFDEFGNEIKSVELPYKGQTADLNLSMLNLAAGIYSYSLVVNGKITDTKRMIKTK